MLVTPFMMNFPLLVVILTIVTSVAGFQCPRHDGHYAKLGDCKAFYKCYKGKPALLRCPANLYFNAEAQVCDWEQNVNCLKEIFDEPEPNRRRGFDDPYASDDYYEEDIPVTREERPSRRRPQGGSRRRPQGRRRAPSQPTSPARPFHYARKQTRFQPSGAVPIGNSRNRPSEYRVPDSAVTVKQSQRDQPRSRVPERESYQSRRPSPPEIDAPEELRESERGDEIAREQELEASAPEVDLYEPETQDAEVAVQQPRSEITATLFEIDHGVLADELSETYEIMTAEATTTTTTAKPTTTTTESTTTTKPRVRLPALRRRPAFRPKSKRPTTTEKPEDEADSRRTVVEAHKPAPTAYVRPVSQEPYRPTKEPVKTEKPTKTEKPKSMMGFFFRKPTSAETQATRFTAAKISNNQGGILLPTASSKPSPLANAVPVYARPVEYPRSTTSAPRRPAPPRARVTPAPRVRPQVSAGYTPYTDAQNNQCGLKSNEPITKEIEDLRQISCMAPNSVVKRVRARSASNPPNVKVLESIFSEEQFNTLFPKAHRAYTYDNFLKAFAKFPAVCEDELLCRYTLATMFAHFKQETDNLYYLEEINKSDYCATWSDWLKDAYPCVPGRRYFGRGSKQLSWNYNYGAFSNAMFGDPQVLLENPDWVADTWLNFASALWFYVNPQPPKPSMMAVVHQAWEPSDSDLQGGRTYGFGVTTMIVNGGIECGEKATNLHGSKNRQEAYIKYAEYFDVDIRGEKLDCADMEPFDATGSANPSIYWAPENGCTLASWQTAYSALVDGDYDRCINDKAEADYYDYYYDEELKK